MLSLLVPSTGSSAATPETDAYEAGGTVAFALRLRAGGSRTWSGVVEGFWSGHRRNARSRP